MDKRRDKIDRLTRFVSINPENLLLYKPEREHPERLTPAARARQWNPENCDAGDTTIAVQGEILRSWSSLRTQPGAVVLNVGRQPDELGLCPAIPSDFRISEFRLPLLFQPLSGGIENLPLTDGSVDTIICAGQAINHRDLVAVLCEFKRVLRLGGSLLLEFESSCSAELLGNKSFGKSATLVETFRETAGEVSWLYSPSFVVRMLEELKLSVRQRLPLQILLAWSRLVFRSQFFIEAFADCDRFARILPFMSRCATSYLFTCEKKG